MGMGGFFRTWPVLRQLKDTRSTAITGDVLILAGARMERWSVFKAGFQSARDPKYAVRPQRLRAVRAGQSSRSEQSG